MEWVVTALIAIFYIYVFIICMSEESNVLLCTILTTHYVVVAYLAAMIEISTLVVDPYEFIVRAALCAIVLACVLKFTKREDRILTISYCSIIMAIMFCYNLAVVLEYPFGSVYFWDKYNYVMLGLDLLLPLILLRGCNDKRRRLDNNASSDTDPNDDNNILGFSKNYKVG